MPCDRCPCRETCDRYKKGGTCSVEADYIDSRRRQLAEAVAEDGGAPLLHEALITVAVWSEVRLGRVLRYLGAVGEFLDAGGAEYAEYQPAAREVPRLMDAVRKALAELNLTPRARARLQEKPDPGGGFLAVLQEAKAIEARERAKAAQDAEFEGEGKEGGNSAH